MENSKPKAQSTPNYVIKGRRGIKDNDHSVQSPIPIPESAGGAPLDSMRSSTRSPSKSPRPSARRRTLSESGSDDSEVWENDDNLDALDRDKLMIPECAIPRTIPEEITFWNCSGLNKKPAYCPDYPNFSGLPTRERPPKNPNNSNFSGLPTRERPPKNPNNSNFQVGGVVAFICLVIGLMAVYKGYIPLGNVCENSPKTQLDEAFKPAKLQYLNQKAALWRGIAVLIDEVLSSGSPQSIVFLYEPEGLEKLQEILKIVAEAATCRLRCCDKQAVRLNSFRINSIQHEFGDYGVLIEMFGPDLEESGVLVMENLSQISGQVAQAFHLFCDDSSPVVNKALIVFTVQVKKLPIATESAGFLRNVLAASWTDIGTADKFDQLFARIAGHIELIQS